MSVKAYDKNESYKIGDKVQSPKIPRYRGEVSFTAVEGEDNTYIAVARKAPQKASTGGVRGRKAKSNTDIAITVLSAKATGEQGEDAIASFATSFSDKEIDTIIKGFQSAKKLKDKLEKEKQAKLEKVKSLGMSKEELLAIASQL